MPAIRVGRVQPAHMQVAAQLRTLIVTARLDSGQRLPSADVLAASFGVSRATTREALRLLTTENLIETRRGVGGGVFVTHPDPGEVGIALSTAVRLAIATNRLSMDELFEMWQITHVPAAALAARRRTDEHIRRLMQLSEPLDDTVDHDAALRAAIEFHAVVLEAAGNRILQICSRPLTGVGADSVPETASARRFLAEASTRHRVIAAAIAAGDVRGARRAMTNDLEQPAHYHALIGVIPDSSLTTTT